MRRAGVSKTKNDQVVLTARDLLKGYKASNNDFNIFNMTPLQMIPAAEKDDDWKKWNLDWLERAAIRSLNVETGKMLKNYFLANGLIDKWDYMIGPHNEMNDYVSIMATDSENKLPIKFYPLIPNVVKILCGEFAKRDSRIIVKAVDDESISEAFEAKKQRLTEILTKHAEAQRIKQLRDMGISINSQDPQVQQLVNQEISTAQMLAQAQVEFKSYRGIAEQWANHMTEWDYRRFNMYEWEALGFRDSLVTDRAFWEIKLCEDDYKLLLWNPVNVFYHKSPNTLYMSESNYVGNVQLMSIPDVIDTFGHQMTELQLTELKNGYKIINNMPLIDDAYRDQYNFYNDYSKTYPNMVQNVTWGQYLDGKFMEQKERVNADNNAFDFSWFDMRRMNTDYFSTLEAPGMVRVTQVYWRSQRKVGKLTKVDEAGTVTKEIVDEAFRVTIPAVYDKSVTKDQKAENLLYGEHIEWTWINEVRWGVKINSSLNTYYTRNYTTFEPIYIGGDPLPFQFKGDNNIYGCKIPVEGRVFTDRNSVPNSFVDLMKPGQILFNICNNQIVEYLADDPNKVIVLDQNMIPKNSLNGEWGKFNFPQFYQIMKDYQIAPVDPSLRNTEGATNFSHFQAVDLSRTEQILARIKLAEYAKNMVFEVVGLTQQRMGEVAASESATGVNMAVSKSYAQTEPYFDQYMNHLMPRVRQLMLDAAQFICATKPNSRGTYMNSDEENIYFDMEGTKNLLREYNIISMSTADIKATLEKLQDIAMKVNTAAGTLTDYARMITMKSPAQIIAKLQEADEKRQQQQQAAEDAKRQAVMDQQAAIEKQEKMKIDGENYRAQLKANTEVLVAQIGADKGAKDLDMNGDGVPDPFEALDMIEKQRVNSAQMLNQRMQTMQQQSQHEDQMDLERDRLQAEREKMQSDQAIEAMKIKHQNKQKSKK